MTEYDLFLTNLAEMCKLGIEFIDEKNEILPTNRENTKLITPLDDAYTNILNTKKALEEFKTSFSASDIYKLLTIRQWKKKSNPEDTYFIECLDLRSMTIRYYVNCGSTGFKYERKIDCFLEDFEPY